MLRLILEHVILNQFRFFWGFCANFRMFWYLSLFQAYLTEIERCFFRRARIAEQWYALSVLTLLCFITFASLPLYASEKVKEEGSKELTEEDRCKKKKVSSRGRPNRIRGMASMNAVIQWIRKAKKQHGEEYAQWHSAKDGLVSCDKIKGSDYHICFAGGKPCKPAPPKEEKKLPRKDEEDDDLL